MVSPRYLLDTNILSELVKSTPDPRVAAHYQTHNGLLTTAATVWHELRFGMERMPDSRRRQVVQRFLEQVVGVEIPVLPYDEQAATWHAEQRARLQAGGYTPPFIDGQIAAVAAVNQLVLVTRNIRDFSRFEGLKLENWFSA